MFGNRFHIGLSTACCVAASCLTLLDPMSRADDVATLDIDVGRRGPEIPPQFFGLMTEEINHSYDGGLYAELIQNRTFQDPMPRERQSGSDRALPIHWTPVGDAKATLVDAEPVNPSLPLSLRVELSGTQGGVANDGYWGIPIRPDTTYTTTFYAKGDGITAPVTAALRTDGGDKVIASADTPAITGGWQKYTVQFKTPTDAPTTAKARFALTAKGSGSVSFSYVSLFPPTYQDAPNGLRPDLMKLLADMRPKFIRLPGGNYVEGNRFSDRFNWKQMIGPPDQRPGHMSCWGYRSSDGFGMPEFLRWCKQLDAEPVLAVFAGYTLNGDHFRAGSEELAIYAREALEEIEYVMGPADSAWGKKRAADGFPEPFKLRYVEIGNEDWFDRSGSYDGRFTQIAKAIRERYPQLKLIATAPVKSFKPDLYDDHFYRGPRALREMVGLYDKPTGTPAALRYEGGGWTGRQPDDAVKTFVGEWAAQEAKPITNLNSALADAAFVMGMERNADAIDMQCYAPLFANVNLADPAKGYPRGWQWEYNLIGYDALRSFGSPSYHAQAMLAQNKGDFVLDAKLDAPASKQPAEPVTHGAIGLGAWRSQVEYADLTVTGVDGKTLLKGDSLNARSWQTDGGSWRSDGTTIRPGNADAESWAVFGDPSWTDYTVQVRARKREGQEGFILLFRATDTGNYRWWNIGGWGNTSARAEAADGGAREPYGPGVPIRIEDGRWYDLKLEVRGQTMRGFIDGKLVTEAVEEPRPTQRTLFATSTYSEADHTVIVKVVNAGKAPAAVRVRVAGVKGVASSGTAIVLSGEPGAVNTLDEPRKVAPREEPADQLGTTFQRTFPPYSLTILRVPTTE